MTHRRVVMLLVVLGVLSATRGGVAQNEPGPPVQHTVLFAWNPGMSPADEAQFLADSRRLLAAIPGVLEVRGGRKAADQRDVHVKDYDVAVSVRLRTLADLPSYAADPRHVELLARWKDRILRSRVVDFFAE